MARNTSPALTSTGASFTELAGLTLSELLTQIDDGDANNRRPNHHKLNPKLFVRESTGKPNKEHDTEEESWNKSIKVLNKDNQPVQKTLFALCDEETICATYQGIASECDEWSRGNILLIPEKTIMIRAISSGEPEFFGNISYYESF